jgi:hypothetical protein
MRVTFVMTLEDPVDERSITLTRTEEVPWPAVPRSGDRVQVPVSGVTGFRAGTRLVEHVSYQLDGSLAVHLFMGTKAQRDAWEFTVADVVQRYRTEGWLEATVHVNPTDALDMGD